eukprot:TRINITY_DN14308_c0_g1_i1.p1 TRINITY_DN14308_c0_g1~~TRINITY_DN14308_c0_g1_i1.p1  ORF type:complete len:232 (+),score=45.64 TRINITY_DN14308_c0_g1_i1:1-696(+)
MLGCARSLSLTFLLLFVSLVASQGTYGPTGYTYPDRYQSIAKFSTADYTTGFEPIYGVAYIYTDYVEGAQRVDELWNITSIQNTMFYDMFAAVSDRHLNFETYGFYYYENSTGPGCALLPFGSLLSQNLFSDPSTFVGNVTGHNNKILSVYNATVSFADIQTYAALYVDAETLEPNRLHIYGAKGIIGDSDLKYIDFQAVEEPFSSTLFDVPEVCPGNAASDVAPRPPRFF